MTGLPQIEKVLLLRGASLFHHCNAEEVVRIASIATERRFERDDVIYARGDAADAIYFVVSGSVAVEPAPILQGHMGQPPPHPTTIGQPPPHPTTMGLENDGMRPLGPRETFGVREILAGGPREARALALEPTVTLAIEADDFFDLLSHDIEIVKALFREVLAERSGNGATP